MLNRTDFPFFMSVFGSLTRREYRQTENDTAHSVFSNENSSGKMDMLSSRMRWTLGYRGIGSTGTCKHIRKGTLKLFFLTRMIQDATRICGIPQSEVFSIQVHFGLT